MIRKKNTEVIVQIVILIGIVILLLYGMLSKKVNYYVHPRFHFGIWVSILVLLMFVLSLISNIKKARHNVNIKHYRIFVIPFIAALLFPTAGIKNVNVAMANSNLSSNSDLDERQIETNSDEIDNVVQYEEYDPKTNLDESDYLLEDAVTDLIEGSADEITVEEDTSKKYDTYKIDGDIMIKDDIFVDWYYDVYNNLEYFIGKRYQYIAQVYSMDDFKENQFLAGRYIMTCCAADLSGYGIICESDIRSELKEDQWITITGTITQYEYNDTMVPMLTDVTITKAEPPEVEYLYYSY